ncbi:MAG TPA: histidine phosphatase family protein [Solirubrobacteraceae bacterium]|nr:histidine phosphatase family protein [Solirubrobacteraceae bacterium]
MILLARHGETDANRAHRFQGRRDPTLNDTGREQARALAAEARGENVAVLYASPLLRAWETAAIVGEALGLEPRADERLVEIDVGDWAGRLHEEVAHNEVDTYRAWIDADERFRFPGGESIGEQRARVCAAIADVRARGESPALLICHGGTIRAALLATLGPEAIRLRPRNGSLHRLPVPIAGGDRV